MKKKIKVGFQGGGGRLPFFTKKPHFFQEKKDLFYEKFARQGVAAARLCPPEYALEYSQTVIILIRGDQLENSRDRNSCGKNQREKIGKCKKIGKS